MGAARSDFDSAVARYNALVDLVERLDGIGPDRFRGRSRPFMNARAAARMWLYSARAELIDAERAGDLGEPRWSRQARQRSQFETFLAGAEAAYAASRAELDDPSGARCRVGDAFEISDLHYPSEENP
jgi:hypothetical protein